MDFSLVQVSSQQKDLKIKFCRNLSARRYPDSGQSSVRSLLPTFLNVMAEFPGPFFTVKLYAFLPSSHFTRESTRTFSILRDFLCIHTNPEILSLNILTPCLSTCGDNRYSCFLPVHSSIPPGPLLSPQIQQAISRVGKNDTIQVAVVWRKWKWKYWFSSPDEMLVPGILSGFFWQFTDIIYTSGKKEAPWKQSVRSKNKTSYLGLESS